MSSSDRPAAALRVGEVALLPLFSRKAGEIAMCQDPQDSLYQSQKLLVSGVDVEKYSTSKSKQNRCWIDSIVEPSEQVREQFFSDSKYR